MVGRDAGRPPATTDCSTAEHTARTARSVYASPPLSFLFSPPTLRPCFGRTCVSLAHVYARRSPPLRLFAPILPACKIYRQNTSIYTMSRLFFCMRPCTCMHYASRTQVRCIFSKQCYSSFQDRTMCICVRYTFDVVR